MRDYQGYGISDDEEVAAAGVTSLALMDGCSVMTPSTQHTDLLLQQVTASQPSSKLPNTSDLHKTSYIACHYIQIQTSDGSDTSGSTDTCIQMTLHLLLQSLLL